MRVRTIGWIFGGVLLAVANPCFAQQIGNGNGNSGVMWGTAAGASPSFGDSASSHATDGVAAGQVNAAKAGYLFGPNISITTVGVQNIVNNTVDGSNNNITNNVNQTGANNGPVNNSGGIAK